MVSRVGYVRRRWTDDERSNWNETGRRPLVTDIWYPTRDDAEETELFIGPRGRPVFVSGRVAEDAPIAPPRGGCPCVLLSHGTGGSALQHGWLATALASRGTVVLGVNHHGNTTLEMYAPQGFCLWWERTRDLTVALDHLLADETFGPHVDVARVGAAGFSLGGYTVMGLAGGRTDLDAWRTFARGPERDATTEDQQEFPGVLARFRNIAENDRLVKASLARHGESFRDLRVRSVFAMAPVLAEAFDAATLAAISVPVALVVGAADDVAPPATNAERYAARIPGAELTVLPGEVGHATFLSECTPNGARAVPKLCREHPSVDRGAVHRQVAELAGAWFARADAGSRGEDPT